MCVLNDWGNCGLPILFKKNLLLGKAAIQHFPLFTLLIGRHLTETHSHLWHHESDHTCRHTRKYTYTHHSVICHSGSEKRTKRQKTKKIKLSAAFNYPQLDRHNNKAKSRFVWVHTQERKQENLVRQTLCFAAGSFFFPSCSPFFHFWRHCCRVKWWLLIGLGIAG